MIEFLVVMDSKNENLTEQARRKHTWPGYLDEHGRGVQPVYLQ